MNDLKFRLGLIALLGALGGASAAYAAPETPAAAPAVKCPAQPVLPPDLADWARTSSSKTMRDYQAGSAAKWPALGNARTGLALHPADKMAYWVAPERPAEPGKFGGMVPIAVTKAGRLTVALDAGAWIDLVRDGAVVRSAGHGHGPECSGIRKMVQFDVTPGRYLLQIVNAPDAPISAMAVMRQPAP